MRFRYGTPAPAMRAWPSSRRFSRYTLGVSSAPAFSPRALAASYRHGSNLDAECAPHRGPREHRVAHFARDRPARLSLASWLDWLSHRDASHRRGVATDSDSFPYPFAIPDAPPSPFLCRARNLHWSSWRPLSRWLPPASLPLRLPRTISGYTRLKLLRSELRCGGSGALTVRSCRAPR